MPMCEASNFEEPGAVVSHAGICAGAAHAITHISALVGWRWTRCGVPCEIYALHNRKGRLQMCKAMAGKWCRQMLRERGAVT